MTLCGAPAGAQLDRVFDDPAPCSPDHFIRTTFFGRAVAPLGTRLLVGAGGEACEPGHGIVYLLSDASAPLSFLNPQPGAGDFGVAVATIGSDVLAGAPDDSGFGKAYRFNGTTAAFQVNYTSPASSTNDQFGRAVANVAGTVLVGAPRVDTTGTDAGAAYLFDATSGALLRTYANPSPGTKFFGTTVAALGANVLIGAPAFPGTGGAVYLFDRLTGALKRTFPSPTATANGFATAIATVGTAVAVGAPAEGVDGVGAVYLFDSASGALLHTFDDPRAHAGDAFGTSVAAIGTTVLVGAPGTAPDREGTAYLFDADPASSTFGALRQTFFKSQLVPKVKPDHFGAVVAAVAGSPVIGAPGYPSQPDVSPGSVYRFDVCGNGSVGAAEQCDGGPPGLCNWCALNLCGPTPALGCRRAPAGSSTLVLQHPASGGAADHSSDKLVFRWKGPATTKVELGDPRVSTSYMLCLYDSNGTSPQPLMDSAAPAAGSCGDRPCWQQSGPVILKYKDRLKSPNGLLSILLRPGDSPFLRFRGRGTSMMLPQLPLTTSVTVQVRNTDTGVCWDAVYGSDVRSNSATLFKAASD